MSELYNVSKISFGNTLFNLYSIPVTLDILFAIIIEWFFHDKHSSSNMPRKSLRSICILLIEIFIFFICFCFLWIPLTSFYSYLKTIYLALAII